MRFRTKILAAGKTAAGIEVPPKVVAALGSSKRPPVRATINGFTYRLELDIAAREVELPPDFAAALNRDAKAKKFFAGLSYSKKKILVTPLEVKAADVRKARIAKTVAMLREGRT
jgi:hypothetical protein